MTNRAYSILSVKALDDAQRVITGIATTPTVDRVGDIIDPMGASFAATIPFLWQHVHDAPVGETKFGKPTANGIPFETKFVHPDSVESATLKDRLQLAWDSVKTGLVRAVSIGFRPIKYAFMDGGGIEFQEIEIFELSGVTIPANAEAVITAIKSMDTAARKAAGVPEPEIPANPDDKAAPGKKVVVVKLVDPARDRAPPVVIKSIKPVRATQ
ncbi:HK97 family phage prohead protease [Sphingomonas sanxanigenens]|uniref:HK97 family phage prohead protease n=1 Tax=Sphingomonas sanxanigenens TaxID=397260 RepID=UPI0004B8D891|nr:HK97 family phage prohead protease [Sphingomonas sanxanigenens]